MEISDEQRLVLASLDYDTLIRFAASNQAYQRVITSDRFWLFKIERDAGDPDEYFTTALLNGWLEIVSTLIKTHRTRIVSRETILALVRSCDNTPQSKKFYLILFLLQPYYNNDILEAILSVIINHFHPNAYLGFITEFGYTNLGERLSLATAHYVPWSMKCYLKIFDEHLEKYFNVDNYSSTLAIQLIAYNDYDNLMIVLGHLNPENPIVVPPVHTITSNMLEILEKNPNFDLTDYYKTRRKEEKVPIPSPKPRKPRQKPSTAVVLEADDHLVVSLREALENRDIEAFEFWVKTMQGSKYSITYQTADGFMGSFFLSQNSLAKLKDFLLLPTSVQERSAVGDYIFDFMINPIINMIVTKYN